jgi:hypothetical protein
VDFQELRETDFTPEQAVLTRMLLFFGPLPQGLLKQIDDEMWEGSVDGTIANGRRRQRFKNAFLSILTVTEEGNG